MSNRCQAFDYTGIVGQCIGPSLHNLSHISTVLIVGSSFPCIYYAFYCQPGLQRLYLSGITIAGLGASVSSQLISTPPHVHILTGAATIVLNPEYGKPTHRGARTKVFISLGLSGIIPVAHALHVHGFANLVHEMGFGYLLLSGALYIVGALI